jgi:hypothetical protein
MALQSMTALANIVLQSPSGTVSFSNIPQNYKDLVLVSNFSTTSSVQDVGIRFNSDAGSNYPYVEAAGNGSAASSSNSTRTYNLIGYTITAAKVLTISQILDYSVTDKHKSVLTRENDPGNALRMIATRWANTSAITSMTIITQINTFATGSTFSLYGRIA